MCGKVEKHEIIPVVPETDIAALHEQISLSVRNVVVSLPDDFNADTLKRLLEGLSIEQKTAIKPEKPDFAGLFGLFAVLNFKVESNILVYKLRNICYNR